MNIVLLSEGAKLPARASQFAAGYDLYVPKDVVINPGRNLVPLDIQIELPPNTEAQIRPRSGFSLKGIEGNTMLGYDLCRFDADVLLGTIDEDYRGNVGVIIKSYEPKSFIVKQGTRIAQMVISHYCSEQFELSTDLTATERGEQGFGHTGSK